MARTRRGRYMVLMDLIRRRVSEPESVSLAKEINKFRRRTTIPFSYFAVESNGVGLPLAQNLMEAKIPVAMVTSHKDKMARSVTARVRLAAGQIFFPAPGTSPWYQEFEDELLKFPGGDHDDQVDMLSLAATSIFGEAPFIMGHKGANGSVSSRADMERPVSNAESRGMFGMGKKMSPR